MEHYVKQRKLPKVQSSEPENYLKHVKQEPTDISVKNELFEEQIQDNVGKNNLLSLSLPIWSLLVEQTRFLLQEEYSNCRIDNHLITKVLIKQVNELLLNVVKFFQDCYNPISGEEKSNEETLEVDGLLVNILRCHPQNLTCCYKICDNIPKIYLETLFSSFYHNDIEDDGLNEDHVLPYAPNVELNIKEEITDGVLKKKSKDKKDRKEKIQKEHICDICGKSLREKETLKLHIAAVHEKKKQYKCKKCENSYSYRGGLREHRKSGRCKGAPSNEYRWIKWGNNCDPKCIHPDCVDKGDVKFTFAGIMNHIIDVHTPGPDDSVSVHRPSYHSF